DPWARQREPSQVREIKAAEGLEEDRWRRKRPVGDDDIAHNDCNRPRVARQAREEHIESRAQPRPEQQGRGQYVNPLDDEIAHVTEVHDPAKTCPVKGLDAALRRSTDGWWRALSPVTLEQVQRINAHEQRQILENRPIRV